MKRHLSILCCAAACGTAEGADHLTDPPPQPQAIRANSTFVAIEPPPVTGGTVTTVRIAYASVHVAIAGGIARTTIDEVMVNDAPSPAEAMFSFPLPDDATVTDFADWRDGKRVAASLTGKDEARARFDQAASAGKTASLGEQDGRTFAMKLAPVPARGSRRVELAYTQTVHSLGGERTWSLPAKRYSDQIPTHLDLVVDLVADREITAARELNHDDVRVERASLQHATVFLARNRRSLERDVVVRWTEPTADLDLAGRAVRVKAGEPAYVTARFGFERDLDAAWRKPIRAVLVLDRSLSMAGEPIDHARSLAAGVLDGLGPNDTVGLVAFAGDVHVVAPERATPAQRAKIDAELGVPVAAGGSNLAAALDEAATILKDEPNGVVVLMTDGQPTVGADLDGDIPATRAADVAKARVVIAHFNYPSRQAALEHLFPGAQLHYVPDGRAGADVVRQLVRLAVAPTIDGLKLTLDGAAPDSVQGVVPSTLALGEDVQLAARADKDITVRVTGNLHGKPISLAQTITVPAAPDGSGDAGLATEWARLRIADLERKYAAGDTKLEGEIKKLGTDYRLATRFTSFIADEDSLSPDRIRPGDPEIRVRAPKSTEAVYAVLPWGEVVHCVWLDDEGVWLGRFLVPRGARDGTDRVRVITSSQGVVTLRSTLLYRVDDEAPTFALDARYDRGVLHLRATPKTAVFDEKRTGDSIRGDRVDLRRAVVRVAGKDVELARDATGDTWSADIAVVPSGKLSLVLVTSDYAGNAATATKELEL